MIMIVLEDIFVILWYFIDDFLFEIYNFWYEIFMIFFYFRVFKKDVEEKLFVKYDEFDEVYLEEEDKKFCFFGYCLLCMCCWCFV